jgi:hypothetical protein
LKTREYIKDIIMRPIWQRFGLRKPKVDIDEASEECQRTFGVVCSFIGIRDLIQEHIAFRVWPLVEKWEMPKETITKSDEGGLIRMKFTFRYEGKSGKDDASAAPSEAMPKRKKVKVLTHRPRFIEPAIVPEFVGEASSATEAKEPTPAQKTEELTATPKVEKIEEPRAEGTKTSEILSHSAEVEVPKTQKGPAVTPKRKRMVNVLDVLETIKSSSSTPRKIAEAQKAQIETTASEAEATKHQVEIETGPSEPAKEKSLETGGETTKEAVKQILPEKTLSSTPEASSKLPDYIVRHASDKMLPEEEKREAHHYAQKLKYPKGALIFNGSGEEDFLYCLPDSKEISVCWEMARSFGFPTLEDGLSVLSKDELADSLAYNSLKVRK